MKSSIHRLLSRRNLLRNTALMALLAPVIRQLEVSAADPASPRRVILLYSPNGPMEVSGPASGTETAFTLHDWWKPLERHKADGIFMSHTACTGADTVDAEGGHELGGQTYSGYGAGAGGDPYANNGETIDQVIGKRLEQEGRAGVARSLVWGTVSNSDAGGTGDAFCAGPGRTITPETDAQKAWQQLFASFMAPAADPQSQARAAALLARDKSVLDFVIDDCQSLQGAIGAEGVRLLDDHCTTLRSMEKNLTRTMVVGGDCRRPDSPPDMDWVNTENRDAQTSAFNDLMATTLACELSHVIAFQIGGPAARNQLPDKYGVPSSPQADSGDSGPAHHPWTHQGESSAKTDALRIFTMAYAEQVAGLLDKLKTTNDALGKPLLDSTMVLWLSELGGSEGNGDAHITKSVPALLFGNGQGTFKTGRYLKGKSDEDYKEAGRDNARLLVSLIQYMGLTDVKTVGATGVSGPLSALYG